LRLILRIYCIKGKYIEITYYNITFNGRPGRVKIANDLGEIRLYVERSDDSTAFIVKDFSARGRDFESALRNAQRSGYEFNQTDSIIILDKYLHFPPKQAYRDTEKRGCNVAASWVQGGYTLNLVRS